MWLTLPQCLNGLYQHFGVVKKMSDRKPPENVRRVVGEFVRADERLDGSATNVTER